LPNISRASRKGGNGTIVISITANLTENLRTANILFNDEIHVMRQNGLLESGNPDFINWLNFTADKIAAMQPNSAEADGDRDKLGKYTEWKLSLNATDFASRLTTTPTI
jgi:hypothetical protein